MKNEGIIKLIESLAENAIDKIDLERSTSKISRSFRFEVKPDTNENVVHSKIEGLYERFIISCKDDKARYFKKLIDSILNTDLPNSNISFVRNKLLEYRILDFLFNLSSRPLQSNFNKYRLFCESVETTDFENLELAYSDLELSQEPSEEYSSDDSVYSYSECDHVEETEDKREILEEGKPSNVVDYKELVDRNTINVRDHDLKIDYSCFSPYKISNVLRLGYLTEKARPKKLTSEIIVGLNLLWAIQGIGNEGIDHLLGNYELTHISMSTLSNAFYLIRTRGKQVGDIRRFCELNDDRLGVVVNSVCSHILDLLQNLDCFINKFEKFVRLIAGGEFSLLGVILSLQPWIRLIGVFHDVVSTMESFILDNVMQFQQNVKIVDYLTNLMEKCFYSDQFTENINLEEFDWLTHDFVPHNLIISSVFSTWITSIQSYMNLVDLGLFHKHDSEVILQNIPECGDIKGEIKMSDYDLAFDLSESKYIKDITLIIKMTSFFKDHSKFFKRNEELLGDHVFSMLAEKLKLVKTNRKKIYETFKYGDYITDCDVVLQKTISTHFEEYFSAKIENILESGAEWHVSEEFIDNPVVSVRKIISEWIINRKMKYSQEGIRILKFEFNFIYILNNLIKNFLFFDFCSTNTLLDDIFSTIEDPENAGKFDKKEVLNLILMNLNLFDFNAQINGGKFCPYLVDCINSVDVDYPFSGLLSRFISKTDFERLIQVRSLIFRVILSKYLLERTHLYFRDRMADKTYFFLDFCVLRGRLLSVISAIYRNLVFSAFLEVIPSFMERIESSQDCEEVISLWNHLVRDLLSLTFHGESEEGPREVVVRLTELSEELYWTCRNGGDVEWLGNDIRELGVIVERFREEVVVRENGKYGWMIDLLDVL